MRDDRYKQVPRGRFGGGHARGSFRADRAGGQDGAPGGDDPRASGDGHVHDSSDRGKNAFFLFPTGPPVRQDSRLELRCGRNRPLTPGWAPTFWRVDLRLREGKKAPQGKIFMRRKIAVAVVAIYHAKVYDREGFFSRFCSRALFFSASANRCLRCCRRLCFLRRFTRSTVRFVGGGHSRFFFFDLLGAVPQLVFESRPWVLVSRRIRFRNSHSFPRERGGAGTRDGLW